MNMTLHQIDVYITSMERLCSSYDKFHKRLFTHLCALLQSLIELIDAEVGLPHVWRVSPVKLRKGRRVKWVRVHGGHIHVGVQRGWR